MHRFRNWGLSAALVAGAGAPVAFAEPPKPVESKPWYARLFGSEPAKPAAPPGEKLPPAVAPLGPEAMAEALRAEQDAYLRRMDVCTKLRQVAAETNDDKLFEQADLLEQQATALYHSRVARFGVRGTLRPGKSPTKMASKPAPAEEKLDKALGSAAAADPLDRLTPPEPPRPATAEARPFREVKP